MELQQSQGVSAATIILVPFMSCINAVATLMNMFLIITILKNCKLRQTLTNIFVLNLCVLDFLSSIFVLPMSIHVFLEGKWTLNEEACKASGFLNSFFAFSSILSVCIISIERYYSIRRPMHHAAHMTSSKTALALIIVWVQSGVFASLPLMGFNSYEFRQRSERCSYTWDTNSSDSMFVILIGCVCFVIPGCIICIMYCGIFMVAKSAAIQVHPGVRTIAQFESSTGTTANSGTSYESNLSASYVRESNRPNEFSDTNGSRFRIAHPLGGFGKHFKAMKKIMTILLVYVVLWGPHFIFQMYGAINGYIPYAGRVEYIAIWLGYATFALNPFLYGWMNRTIREALISMFKQIFCCIKDVQSQFHPQDRIYSHENILQFLQRTVQNDEFPVHPNNPPPTKEVQTHEKDQSNSNFMESRISRTVLVNN